MNSWAALHQGGKSYQGPASIYTLDLDYLLLRPLEGLLRAPSMTGELRPQFEKLGLRLHELRSSQQPNGVITGNPNATTAIIELEIALVGNYTAGVNTLTFADLTL